MKTIITIPLVLIIAMSMISCGTSPEPEEPVALRQFPQSIQEPVSFEQTAIPVNSAVPVANRVAGRPDCVFNPYNQNMVEVRGIPSGTKVRDPQDPNPSHVFIVP